MKKNKFEPNANQRRVIRLVMRGLSNNEVGKKICKSGELVKKILSPLYAEAGAVNGRTQFAVIAMEKQWHLPSKKHSAHATVGMNSLHQLFKSEEMERCLRCPNGNPMRTLKKFVEDNYFC